MTGARGQGDRLTDGQGDMQGGWGHGKKMVSKLGKVQNDSISSDMSMGHGLVKQQGALLASH